MPLNDLVEYASIAVILAGAVYVLLRALNLRRVLVDRPYRDRALGTAIGGLSVVFFVIAGYADAVFGEVPTTSEGVIVEAVVWGVAFLFLFGWIVANINVSISADYFNRDALGWKRGGWVVTLVVFFFGWFLASIPTWWVPRWLAASAYGNDLISLTFFAAIGYAAVVLSLTYFRIRDMRIKAYTKWVVLSLLSLFVYLLFLNSGSGWLLVVVWASALVWVYSVHGMISSLAIRTRNLA